LSGIERSLLLEILHVEISRLAMLESLCSLAYARDVQYNYKADSIVVKAVCYKLEGHGFETR
jgi:hypothetical protein